METLPVRVAVLHAGDLSAEQRAAYDWGERAAAAVDRVALADVADGTADLGEYDVLWWHRDRPLADAGDATADAAETTTADAPGNANASGCGSAVQTYVADGGGLLLTLCALGAVAPFGIDPVAPDAVGRERPAERTGFLCKAVHADHPIFETFDGLRVYTRGPGSESPYARYEAVLPRDGDVLACRVRGGRDAYEEKALLAWRHGAGRVIGAGASVGFDAPADFEHAARRAQLVRNALAVLGGDRYPALTGRPSTGTGFHALRERLADDHHRPRYHLSPPANWLNDPNGLVRWKGRYHVFYQYNPAGPFHDTIHWGHATSDDLVDWTDEPVALAPSPDGPDREGCWSGCTVDDGGVPTLLYTGGRDRRQLPCLATSDDPDLRAWQKDPDNPVIETPPEEFDALETEEWVAEFRDHCVWREGDTWYHVIGSGHRQEAGTALLYAGEDLRRWEYVGTLLVGDPDRHAAVWECPELLRFDDGDLLHVSDGDRVVYFVGEADLDEPGFDVARSGVLDHGGFYAPQSLDDGGRYLLWGWLPEARGPPAQWDAGWSGALSLPRVVDLADGEVRQRPAPELRELRERRAVEDAFTLGAGERRTLPVSGDALEIAAEVDLALADEFGLVVRESPAGSERTPVRYTGDELVVERAHSSLDDAADAHEQRMPVPEGTDTLSLRAFVDGSIVELYADERRCLTSRIYPTRRDSDGVSVYARGGDVAVESLDVWHLRSVWPAGRRGRRLG